MSITTDKEAFEFSTQKLIEQNAKSFFDLGTCGYRGRSESVVQNAKDEAIVLYKQTEYALEYPESDDQYWDIFEEILYSTQYDSKCAIGHLIDDQHYDSIIEESDITNPFVSEAVSESNPNWILTKESKDMLSLLQTVHDRLDVSEWKNSFTKFQFDKDGNFAGITGILV